MPNIRIISPNSFDAATLTDSPAMVAALPVNNLQDSARARLARSTSLAKQYVYGDWAAATACSGFALWRHNLTGAATIRLKLYSGLGQTGALLYDSGDVTLGDIIPYGSYVYGVDTYGAWLYNDWPIANAILWFASVSALSFELSMDDPANTDGYMQAARIYLGAYFSPTDNVNYGARMRWEDDSTQERTDGGSLRTDTREPYRTFNFSMNWLTEGDRAAFAELLRKAGKTNDMFLSVYPEDGSTKDRDYSVAVKIVQMPDLVHSQPNYFQGSNVTFAEA